MFFVVKSSRAVDDLDRLTEIAYLDAQSNVVRSLDYDYDKASMITNVTDESGAGKAYTDDSLDRLTGETQLDTNQQPLAVNHFAYDLAGNRTSTVIGGVTNDYTLGEGNRLSDFGSGTEVGLDDAGCVTTLVYSAQRRLDLEWNDRYQVTEVETNGAVAEAYTYGALGRRASVTVDGQTTHFVYDGVHIAADVDASGTLLRSYTYGPGIDNILAMTTHSSTETNTYYYLKDHLGSVVAIADENANIVEQYEYDAWGGVKVHNGSGTLLTKSALGNRYTFQGREVSWATGLYYFRARWYDATTGRWLSKDPIGIAGGLNQYAAFADNAVNYVDPDGLLANYFIGAGTSVAAGWLIAKATGADYSWKQAGIDAALGAAGVGLVSKAKQAYRIHKLRQTAKAKGLTRIGRKGYTETWERAGSLERMHIKFKGGSSPGLHPGSKVPRFDWRIDAGTFWDPFTGKVGPGPKSALGHIPLGPPLSSAESAVAGAASGAFSSMIPSDSCQ